MQFFSIGIEIDICFYFSIKNFENVYMTVMAHSIAKALGLGNRVLG